jgi:hypothetical protein
MKSIVARHVIAGIALAIALPVSAQVIEPPVAVKTDGLPSHVRKRLEEKAKKGRTAVIQYINRTRNTHNLYVPDILGPWEERRHPYMGRIVW